MPNSPKTELRGSEMRCENLVPDAFWGAIGYKVNDIPCSHCAQRTVHNGKSVPGTKILDQTSIQKPKPEAFLECKAMKFMMFPAGDSVRLSGRLWWKR